MKEIITYIPRIILSTVENNEINLEIEEFDDKLTKTTSIDRKFLINIMRTNTTSVEISKTNYEVIGCRVNIQYLGSNLTFFQLLMYSNCSRKKSF